MDKHLRETGCAAEVVTVLKPYTRQTLASIRYRLEDSIDKLTGSQAELVLYGNRYTQEPILPGDTTQITIPFAAQWLNQEELSRYEKRLMRSVLRYLEDAKSESTSHRFAMDPIPNHFSYNILNIHIAIRAYRQPQRATSPTAKRSTPGLESRK